MTTKIDENQVNTREDNNKNLPTRSERVLAPSTNVYENEKEAIFIIDMPGVEESSAQISLEKGILAIEGRVVLSATDGYRKEYHESQVNVYRRKFNLGKMVDPDQAVASMKNGQLRLTLPKLEPQKKKITIKTN